jgi:hypothetical protein
MVRIAQIEGDKVNLLCETKRSAHLQFKISMKFKGLRLLARKRLGFSSRVWIANRSTFTHEYPRKAQWEKQAENPGKSAVSKATLRVRGLDSITALLRAAGKCFSTIQSSPPILSWMSRLTILPHNYSTRNRRISDLYMKKSQIHSVKSVYIRWLYASAHECHEAFDRTAEINRWNCDEGAKTLRLFGFRAGSASNWDSGLNELNEGLLWIEYRGISNIFDELAETWKRSPCQNFVLIFIAKSIYECHISYSQWYAISTSSKLIMLSCSSALRWHYRCIDKFTL